MGGTDPMGSIINKKYIHKDGAINLICWLGQAMKLTELLELDRLVQDTA